MEPAKGMAQSKELALRQVSSEQIQKFHQHLFSCDQLSVGEQLAGIHGALMPLISGIEKLRGSEYQRMRVSLLALWRDAIFFGVFGALNIEELTVMKWKDTCNTPCNFHIDKVGNGCIISASQVETFLA